MVENKEQKTPGSLNKAIQDAFRDWKKGDVQSEARLRKQLNLKIRNFMRNKIAPAYLLAGDDPLILKALDKFVKTF